MGTCDCLWLGARNCFSSTPTLLLQTWAYLVSPEQTQCAMPTANGDGNGADGVPKSQGGCKTAEHGPQGSVVTDL